MRDGRLSAYPSRRSMRGLSRSNLDYLRAFAAVWPIEAVSQQPAGKLGWGHVMRLIEKLDDLAARDWYQAAADAGGWSRNVLANQIMNRTYERTGLIDLGVGYPTLGENTPALSGGEAQRLKLAAELHRNQTDTIFVLDEPSVGLHPLDIRTLLDVLQRLLDKGATVIVIEHDLDLIANADHIIDMGPGGGTNGGRIIATGTPDQLRSTRESFTGRHLDAHLRTQRPRSARQVRG